MPNYVGIKVYNWLSKFNYVLMIVVQVVDLLLLDENFLRFAFAILRRFLPEDKMELVKGMTLTADGNGAVFDVPGPDLDIFLAGNSLCALLLEAKYFPPCFFFFFK